MIESVASNTRGIQAMCEKHGVARLWLVGSAARSDFDPGRSDIDFLVDFGGQELGPWMTRYFQLRDELQELLGRSVDLVLASAAMRPEMERSLRESSVPLYAAA